MDDIPAVMKRVSDILLHICKEGGFGSMVIDFERINGDKIRVIVHAGASYKYIIRIPEPYTERHT